MVPAFRLKVPEWPPGATATTSIRLASECQHHVVVEKKQMRQEYVNEMRAVHFVYPHPGRTSEVNEEWVTDHSVGPNVKSLRDNTHVRLASSSKDE